LFTTISKRMLEWSGEQPVSAVARTKAKMSASAKRFCSIPVAVQDALNARQASLRSRKDILFVGSAAGPGEGIVRIPCKAAWEVVTIVRVVAAQHSDFVPE